MPTVIDSLVVELGLDPKKFKEGQRQVAEDMRKLEDRLKSKGWSEGWSKIFDNMRQLQEGSAKHIRGATTETDKLTQAFTVLQGRLLAIAGLFMGGMGIAEFTQHITNLTAATGRLSQNILGISPQRLAAWQAVGAGVGAGAGEIAGGFQALVDQQKEQKATGKSAISAMMGQVGIRPMDINEPIEDVAMRLSKWASTHPDRAYAAHLLASRGGLNQGMINTLMLGPEELQKRIAEMQQFGPTAEQIKKFTDLQTAFAKLTTVAEALGRAVVAANADKLKAVLDSITEFLEKINKGREAPIESSAGTGIRAYTGALQHFAHPIESLKNLWGRITGKGGENAGPGPRASGSATTTGGIDRSKWMQQLDADPALKERFFRHSLGENTDPAANQAIMEEAANRADIRGNKGFADNGNLSYFQGYYTGTITPSMRRMLEENYRKVFHEGSDISKGAIDNSSGWLAAKHKMTGAFETTFESGGETFQRPGTRESGAGERARYPAFRAAQLEQMARRRTVTAGISSSGLTGLAASLMSRQPSRSFDEDWAAAKAGRFGALGGASRALANGPVTTNNTNTSSTHIGEMHVTVPPGASPDGYARGIREKLQNYDNVQNANTGQF